MESIVINKTKKEVIVSIAGQTIIKMEYFIHRVSPEETPLTYANPPDVENQHPMYELEIVQIMDKQGQLLEPRCFGEFISLQETKDSKLYAVYKGSPIYDSIENLTLVSVYALCMSAHLQTDQVILGTPSLQQVRRMLVTDYHFDVQKRN